MENETLESQINIQWPIPSIEMYEDCHTTVQTTISFIGADSLGDEWV